MPPRVCSRDKTAPPRTLPAPEEMTMSTAAALVQGGDDRIAVSVERRMNKYNVTNVPVKGVSRGTWEPGAACMGELVEVESVIPCSPETP